MTQHKVRMLKDCRAHNDVNGKIEPVAKNYVKSQTYSIGDGLLKTFIEMGAIELDSESASPSANADDRETKVVEVAETKPMTAAEKKAAKDAAKKAAKDAA